MECILNNSDAWISVLYALSMPPTAHLLTGLTLQACSGHSGWALDFIVPSEAYLSFRSDRMCRSE